MESKYLYKIKRNWSGQIVNIYKPSRVIVLNAATTQKELEFLWTMKHPAITRSIIKDE